MDLTVVDLGRWSGSAQTGIYYSVTADIDLKCCAKIIWVYYQNPSAAKVDPNEYRSMGIGLS